MRLINIISSAAVAGALSIGAVAVSSSPAIAYVACNSDGDCWHTEDRVQVPGISFDFHPDDWYFHQRWDGDERRHWREYHEGRGYWRGGVWITL